MENYLAEKIKNKVVTIEFTKIEGKLILNLFKKHSKENIEKFSVGAIDIVVIKIFSKTNWNSNGSDLRILNTVK